ncbi:MAG: agmatinase family protein [Bacteroidota bacterium]
MFNPDAPGLRNGNIFGFPFDAENAGIILIPVPWDVTSSYSSGASSGPDAILKASPQLDFFDPSFPEAWKKGIHMIPLSADITEKNKYFRQMAEEHISIVESGKELSEFNKKNLDDINNACSGLNQDIFSQSKKHISNKKMVGVVGGDHSVSLGLVKALAEQHSSFGILHFDAHADLRNAFEGFTFSHASALFNMLSISSVKKLIQVGIRDYCNEEQQRIYSSNDKIIAFDARNIHRLIFENTSWASICNEILDALPENIYISFDIDVLNPSCCPNTGTPVPGGLSYEMTTYLLDRAGKEKNIIGFDLCEVTPGKESELDANIGARILYKLCCISA